MLQTPLRWLLLIFIAFFTLFTGMTAIAQEEVDEETAIRTIILADAFGNSFAGDKYDFTGAEVTFAKKVKPSSFLQPNNAHLVRTSVLYDDGKRSRGTLQYADPYGRLATYLYTIDYAILGTHVYKINNVSIETYEPRNPSPEGYFIPVESISNKEMKSMPTDELLAFARKNGDVVKSGEVGAVKQYHVVVFCMHRLRDDAKWAVTHNGQRGSSWSKGDWHVSSIDATFGLNDQTDQIFRILYSPGKRSPFSDKLFQLGCITNQSLSGWNGPVDTLRVSTTTEQLINAYSAKQQPNLLQ